MEDEPQSSNYTLILPPRSYEKSIIEEAINLQRTNTSNHWDETRQSIREARYRLSLQSDSLELKLNQIHLNGGPAKYETQSLTSKITNIEKEEMDLVNP